MNILHLSAVSNWGGGENHIENLCTELAITNPEINNIVFCVKNGPFHERLKQTNIKHIASALSIKIDLRFAFNIGKACKTHQIDLIHIHDTTAIQLAIIADKIYNLPPFIFSKKTSFEIKQRKKTLYKYNYPKIKKILCVSEETMRISKKAITDHNKLITIYHGTNLKNKSSKTPFKLRDKYSIKNNTIIIGNIANHIRAKHLDTWVNVANRIINEEQKTNFFFVQIGTFTERTQPLLNRVKELNLNNHMIFLGYTSNASNFIPQFDISLMTSQSEGIPQFIYESMYHKVPVVSTNVGGIPEIITHQKNGLLAPMHDDKALSELILQLVDNPKMAENFINLSHKKVTENFSTSQMAQNTIKIYKHVLNNV
ncbi:glycosyl transferase family 1 [Seonamhaeicola sp. S2-3]|uniref:glycosyltransferase family 4 protein n=1 Tax=Seonamhaeicola sp. S2-3 TaxID=1936081 RepID=UPI0009729A11|nr:glycosyltransferase family 4 protein [Seonamhaeicola sp. S2-3]APY11955.1 glycosyl transferase family 1 [Seonamhaeicola sp. S2-3]